MKKPYLMMFAVAGAVVFAEARETYYLKSSPSGNDRWIAFTNATWWVKADGVTPAGVGTLPTDADYVVKDGKQLCTFNSNKKPSPVFVGHSITLGDASTWGTINDYAANVCNADYGTDGGIIFQRGNYVFNNGNTAIFRIYGETTIKSTATASRFYNGQNLKNQMVYWNGDLHGAVNATLQIGRADLVRGTSGDEYFKFFFVGDTSDYLGTVRVRCPEPSQAAPDFKVYLSVGGTFGGFLDMGSHTVLASTNTTSLSAAGFSLSSGSTLQITATSSSAHSSFVARESFSVSGAVSVSVPLLMFDNKVAPGWWDILAVPVGTELSQMEFVIVDSSGNRADKYELVVEKDLSHEYLRLKKRCAGFVMSLK